MSKAVRVSSSELMELIGRGLRVIPEKKRRPAGPKKSSRLMPPGPRRPLVNATAKIMALDLSQSKTGLAWGKAGELPEGTAMLVTSKELAGGGEGFRLASITDSILERVRETGCGFVIFSEFYNGRTPSALRASCSLRGAVMAELARHGIEALPVAEITARKAAGVDLSRPHDTEEPKGYMKRRARARLEQLNLGHLAEDEGDAAILLLGANAVISIGAYPPELLTDPPF